VLIAQQENPKTNEKKMSNFNTLNLKQHIENIFLTIRSTVCSVDLELLVPNGFIRAPFHISCRGGGDEGLKESTLFISSMEVGRALIFSSSIFTGGRRSRARCRRSAVCGGTVGGVLAMELGV